MNTHKTSQEYAELANALMRQSSETNLIGKAQVYAILSVRETLFELFGDDSRVDRVLSAAMRGDLSGGPE